MVSEVQDIVPECSGSNLHRAAFGDGGCGGIWPTVQLFLLVRLTVRGHDPCVYTNAGTGAPGQQSRGPDAFPRVDGHGGISVDVSDAPPPASVPADVKF